MIREIHLTFDSGLQRELLLSASDSYTSRVVRGPQPELIKDYDIEVDGRVVLRVEGNYLRKRVHLFNDPLKAQKARIHVRETHGAPTASIFELRLY